MRKLYKMFAKSVRIHIIDTVHDSGIVFLHDEKNKAYWGSLLYEIQCTDEWSIRYILDEESLEDAFTVEVKGTVEKRRGKVEFGKGAVAVDNRGAYAWVYRVDDGGAYVNGDSIHIVMHGVSLFERRSGDRMGHIFVPDACQVELVEGTECIR